MENKDDSESILDNIYIGIINETLVFKDRYEENNQIFIVIEKLKSKKYLLKNECYDLYKDLYNCDYFYIKDDNTLIYDNFDVKTDIFKWINKITNFYTVKEILVKADLLLNAISNTNEYSQLYYENFLTLESNIINILNDENKKDSIYVIEKIINNLETIYFIALDETKKTLKDKFKNNNKPKQLILFK